MTWLDAQLGKISQDGVELELPGGLNFKGDLKVSRNESTGVIDVELSDAAQAALEGAGAGEVGDPIPDANTTISVADGAIRSQITQTANRTHTLDVDDAEAGDTLLYSRGSEAFTTTFLDESDGSTVIVLAAGATRELEFGFDGAHWGVN